MSVFLKHRCAGKTEQQGSGERVLDADEHLTEHTAMALVNDNHEAFLADGLDRSRVNAMVGVDVGHLLD